RRGQERATVVEHADAIAVGQASRRRVFGVNVEERLALAAHQRWLGGEGGVQEMVRGRRDEREGKAPGALGRAAWTLAGRDVVREQLAFPRGRRELPFRERQQRVGHA